MELRAYNGLALAYFNLSDITESKYYHQRGSNMQIEPEDSRLKHIAVRDLKWKQSEANANKMTEIYKTVETQSRKTPITRFHRLARSYSKSGRPCLRPIEDYKGARRIRQLAEEFLSQKIANDLRLLEQVDRTHHDPETVKRLFTSVPPCHF